MSHVSTTGVLSVGRPASSVVDKLTLPPGSESFVSTGKNLLSVGETKERYESVGAAGHRPTGSYVVVVSPY